MAKIITNDKVEISFGNGYDGKGSPSDGDNVAYIPCKNCKATGWVPDGKGGAMRCPVCNGKGRVTEE